MKQYDADTIIDLTTQALIRAHGVFCEGKTLTQSEGQTKQTMEEAIETSQAFTLWQLRQMEPVTPSLPIPGHHDIDWPYLVQNIECPVCTSEMEVPPEQWTRCPNPECDVQIILSIKGLWRKKPRT